MLRHRKAGLVLLLLVVCVIYYVLNVHPWHWYANKKMSGEKHACFTPEREMDDLKKLIVDLSKILTDLQLTHFPVYGSLWGALRYSDPLPWDNDVDLGLLDHELKKIPHKDFIDAFQRKGIKIIYRMWLGTYRVTRDSARGDLMVFKPTFFNEVSRVGIEPWVFFINYRVFHTFPPELIKKPLPKQIFAGVNMSMPRNSLEFQKHFYPHDWWKESKPIGC